MERLEAKLAGLSKYNTGRQCSNGHNADRYTVSGNCSQCLIENLRAVNADVVDLKRRFIDATTEVNLFIWDVDVQTIKIFINALCALRGEFSANFYEKTWTMTRQVTDDVQQWKVRVPSGLRKEVLAMGEAFLATHRVIQSSAA